MDDDNPLVFQPNDGFGGVADEWAIVIDRGDAPLLRDLLRRAAQDRLNKVAKATQRMALNRNRREHEIFAKYAERCEHVRKGEAERIAAKIRASQS